MQLFAPFLTVFGIGAQVLALCAVISGVYGSLHQSPAAHSFYTSALLLLAIGLIAAVIGRVYQPRHLSPRHMFLITAGTWFSLGLTASLPLYLAPLNLSYTDALFEAVSGFTTTGSTILSGLDSLPGDILLWRSMLQWLGGIGVICMAVLLLPFLHVGGMRLFQTESSHWEDSSNVPRTRDLIRTILKAYAAITLLCVLAYLLGGMSGFDAVNHAMTTVSTGGYSTTDASFIGRPLRLQWIAIIFMLAGSIPFTLYPMLTRRHGIRIWQDRQIRGLLIILLSASALLTIYLMITGPNRLLTTLTLSVFNLTSIITTTGYASSDYNLWGGFAVALVFFATFIGGCSGSTSGGIKIFRLQIFAALVKEQLARSVHPRITVSSFYADQPIKGEIVTALVTYLFLMVSSLVVITILLSASGLDLTTSLSGAATAIMNVGPGLGDIIGPTGNFESLPAFTKWVLSAGMLLGRLEFQTVIILFTASYWRG